jgi:hypothetical protein
LKHNSLDLLAQSTKMIIYAALCIIQKSRSELPLKFEPNLVHRPSNFDTDFSCSISLENVKPTTIMGNPFGARRNEKVLALVYAELQWKWIPKCQMQQRLKF